MRISQCELGVDRNSFLFYVMVYPSVRTTLPPPPPKKKTKKEKKTRALARQKTCGLAIFALFSVKFAFRQFSMLTLKRIIYITRLLKSEKCRKLDYFNFQGGSFISKVSFFISVMFNGFFVLYFPYYNY